MTDFGVYLKDQRARANLTLRQLGGLSQLDFTYLSKLEHNAAPPPAIPSLYRLADALGVPVAEMCAAAGRISRDMTRTELECYVLKILSVIEEARWYTSAFPLADADSPLDAPDGPRMRLLRRCTAILSLASAPAAAPDEQRR